VKEVEMRIGVTCPAFVSTEAHLHHLRLTVRSIKSAAHTLLYVPVYNFVGPAFYHRLPALYLNGRRDATKSRMGRQPQSVAKAWNDGIRGAIQDGCAYVLVVNDDVVLKSNAVDRVVAFAERQHDPDTVLWTMGQYEDLRTLEEAPEDENAGEHPNFSAFMVRADFPRHCGWFDENFAGGYFEDNDMHGRLVLAGKKAVVYGGARFYHFASATLRYDAELQAKSHARFEANRAYFAEKWGHLPVNEPAEMRRVYYQHPYDEGDKPLSYWRPLRTPALR
jgi:hypothetical protein